MKVKILNSFMTTRGKLKAGQVVEVKPKTAKQWIAAGDAEPTV
jgi:hypothetical protein